MAKWDVDKLTCQKCKERSDEVQAAVAATLREAANIARASLDGEIAYDDILDLITTDAQAALDRVVAEERERCAQVAEGLWITLKTKPDSVMATSCFVIAAAIRKGGE